jgi:hypothetical protein
MDCGVLKPDPSVCWASTTTAGACAHAPEALKTTARIELLNILNFEGEQIARNLDGITGMATALLYNFGSVLPSLRGG